MSGAIGLYATESQRTSGKFIHNILDRMAIGDGQIGYTEERETR